MNDSDNDDDTSVSSAEDNGTNPSNTLVGSNDMSDDDVEVESLVPIGDYWSTGDFEPS